MRWAVEALTVTVATPFGASTVTGLTVSVGAALHTSTPTGPDAAATLTGLLWTADRALYDAKHAGRNTTRVCTVDNDLT